MKIKLTLLPLLLSSWISSIPIVSFASPSHSENNLQALLRYALTEDPKILESKANIAIAESKTNISKAGHYPVISATNTQILSQRHKNSSSHLSSRPALKGQVNLYSWGAVENAIERDKYKEEFFRHKHTETKEQVGKSIIDLYLTALRAKEIINVYEKSLSRHKKILKNIKVIANYDIGRDFEVVEAESRLLQTEAIIEQQLRILNITLSQLNRYTRSPLTETNLQDPFLNQNIDEFITRYRSEDLNSNPTYLAQQNELNSAQAAVKVAKAKRLPAVNLEGEVYNKGYNVYVGVSWNIFDSAAAYAVDQEHYSETAAQAKLQDILLELQERARTSQIDMKQNSRRLAIVKKQITSQQKVVKSTELQFDIAQRSLLDVLNAYKELSDIEVEQVNIQNDFRIASLNYLVSQARVADWAGIKNINLKF